MDRHFTDMKRGCQNMAEKAAFVTKTFLCRPCINTATWPIMDNPMWPESYAMQTAKAIQ